MRVVGEPSTISDYEMVEPGIFVSLFGSIETQGAYIKNGVRLRRFMEPMERRTRAPAPSDCSMASTFFAIDLEMEAIAVACL